MKIAAGLVVALVLAGPVVGQAAAREEHPAEAASPGFRDVIRLHEAGLSEEFILRKIGREKVVYRLSTDDVIACKAAGLPESIIEAMMKTAPAAAEVPPPAEAPGVAEVPPVPEPFVVAAPSLATKADRSWESMVRRVPGVVLFRSPWGQGVLSFREEKLSWADGTDPARSFSVPATEILEQFLVCPKDADSDGACFEWGVKTAGAEHRFRAAGWERSGSTKPRELFEFVQAIYPDLATARYRAQKK